MACAALIITTTTASATDGDVWTPASAVNGAFSVDTPCSVDEVIKLRSLPEPLVPGVTFASNTRVACMRGKTMLVAGVFEAVGYPSVGPTMFDSFVEQAKNDKTAEGVQSTTTINGRRAWVNRQEAGDQLAQTGFVEIDRSHIVLAVAGVEANSGLSMEKQRAIVDHFYGSLKVTAR